MTKRSKAPARRAWHTARAHCDALREAASRHFSFLASAGFLPQPDHDACTGVTASVHFLGRHRGFCLSYDLKDDYLGLYMLDVLDGVPGNRRPPRHGWQVSDYLASHGLGPRRVSPQRSGAAEESAEAAARLDTDVRDWAAYLSGPGSLLLEDVPIAESSG